MNCSTIRDVLDDFCTRSGQSISESKSRVYFSPNVDVDTRESLCDILGFKSTPNLRKYLGFPLKHRGGNNQDQNFILDRVKQKLAGWKGFIIPCRQNGAHSSLHIYYSCLCHAMHGVTQEVVG